MNNKLVSALFLLLVISGSCTSTRPVTATYQGKVIAAYCAFVVVDIANADAFEDGVEWKDRRGTLHRNAFTVENFCDFFKAGLKVGDSFEYRIIQEAANNDCEVCMGFMETPSLRKTIQVIRKINE